jgi:hypothetical protein
MDDVIVRDFMLDPSRFFIDVVHAVEGVVRAEDRLTADVDDRDADLALAYPRMRA